MHRDQADPVLLAGDPRAEGNHRSQHQIGFPHLPHDPLDGRHARCHGAPAVFERHPFATALPPQSRVREHPGKLVGFRREEGDARVHRSGFIHRRGDHRHPVPALQQLATQPDEWENAAGRTEGKKENVAHQAEAAPLMWQALAQRSSMGSLLQSAILTNRRPPGARVRARGSV